MQYHDCISIFINTSNTTFVDKKYDYCKLIFTSFAVLLIAFSCLWMKIQMFEKEHLINDKCMIFPENGEMNDEWIKRMI